MGGVTIARPPAGQPFLHGSIGADITRSSVSAKFFVAIHDAFALRIDDGRSVTNGNRINGSAEILGTCCHPTLFHAGQFCPLAKADGIACADTIGAHPYLGAAVGRIRRIGFVERSSATCADDGCFCFENIKFSVTHTKARGPDTTPFPYEQSSHRHTVVDIRPAFQGFFGHDGFELFPVDGNIPLPPVCGIACCIAQYRQPPAFKVFNTFVEFPGIRQGQIFTEWPPAYLRAAPAH